jgi:hypothetical protein
VTSFREPWQWLLAMSLGLGILCFSFWYVPSKIQVMADHSGDIVVPRMCGDDSNREKSQILDMRR